MKKRLLLLLLVFSSVASYEAYGQGWAINFLVDLTGSDCYNEDLNSLTCNGYTGTTEGYSQPAHGYVLVKGTTYSSTYQFNFSGNGTIFCPPPGSNTTTTVYPSRSVTYDIRDMGDWVPYGFPSPNITTGQASYNLTAFFYPQVKITKNTSCKISLTASNLGLVNAPSVTWQVDDDASFSNPIDLTTLTGQRTIELTADELQALTGFPGSPYNATRYFRAKGIDGTQSLSEPVTTPYPPLVINTSASDGINPTCPEGEGKISIVYNSYTAGTVDKIDYTIATFFEKPAGVTSCSNTQPGDVPVDPNIPSGYCYDDYGNFTHTPGSNALLNKTIDSTMILPAINLEEGIVLVYAEATVNGVLGCAVSDTFHIIDPGIVEINGGATQIDRPSCIGGNDGSARITLVNGQSPYTYSVKRISPDSTTTSNTSTTSKTITTSRSLAYGTSYRISVTDNCKDTDYLDFSLTQDGAAAMTLASVSGSSDFEVDCYEDTGEGDATWTVNVSGNYPSSVTGYKYWVYGSDGAFETSTTLNSRTATFTELGKSSYRVRVKAPNNCVSTLTQAFTVPGDLDGTFSITHSCRDENNGRVRFSRTAGSDDGDLKLDLSTGETNTSTLNSVTVSNLSPGTRNFTATDLCLDNNEEGIVPTKTVTNQTVNHLTNLAFSSATTVTEGQYIKLSCYGDDYDVIVGYENGRGPNYNVIVTRNDTVITPTNHNTATRIITLNNLREGLYRVTVSGSCTNNNTITRTFEIDAPSRITAQITPTNLTCFENESGKIQLSVSGGVPGTSADGPKNYLLEIWDNDNDQRIYPDTLSCSTGRRNCVVYTGLNATTNYLLKATDFNSDGVEGVCPVEFTNAIQNLTEPALLRVDAFGPAQLTNEQIFEGEYYTQCKDTANISLNASASGGTPPYRWHILEGATKLSQTTGVFNNLGAGTYTIYVGDQNKCDSSAVQALDIYEADTMLLVDKIFSPEYAHGGNTSCYDSLDGAIHVEVSGGVGEYTYTLYSELDTVVTVKTPATNIFADLPAINSAGQIITYTIALEDEIGCVWKSQNGLGNTTQLDPPDTVEFYWDVISRTVPGHQIPCHGDSAVVSFTSEGGKYPHMIEVDGTFLPIDSLGSAEFELFADTYSPVITDALGCPGIMQTVELVEPASHVSIAAGTITPPICIGGTDGQIEISGANGVQFSTLGEEYLFLIKKENATTFDADTLWGTSNTFLREANRYQPQKYIVQVRDGHDCSDEMEVTMIPNPTPLKLVDDLRVSPSCHGGTDGSITLTASNHDFIGGTSLIFKLSGGHLQDSIAIDTVNSTTHIFENLEGTDLNGYIPYQAWVEDANACTDSADQYLDTLTLISHPPVEVDLIQMIRPSCYNGADGSLNLQVEGGVAPYQYSLDNVNFQNTNPDYTIFLDELLASDYDIYVRDANFNPDQPACFDTTTFTVVDGRFIDLTAKIQSISCKGGNDGEIDLTIEIDNMAGSEVIDHTRLFNSWTHDDVSSVEFSTAEDIASLTKGTYTAHTSYVFNSDTCRNEKSFTVLEPLTPFSIQTLKTYHTSCGIYSDGKVVVSVSGGWTDSLTYYRTDGGAWTLFTGNTFIVNSLPAGDHSVDVAQCDFSCIDSKSFTIESANLQIAISNTIAPSCPMAEDGVIVVDSQDPTAEFAFEDSTSFTSLGVFSGLKAGTYRFIGRKSGDHNCISEPIETVVTDPADCGGGPLSLILLSTVEATCELANDGGAQVMASGGTPPYQYFWDGANSAGRDTLSSGSHLVVVMDTMGDYDSLIFYVNALDPIEVQLLTNLTSCNQTCDGEIQVLATGGSGMYGILWIDGNTEFSRDSLCVGMYNFTIEDNRSAACTVAGDVELDHFPDLSIQLVEAVEPTCPQGVNGYIDVEITGGSGSYSLSWSPVSANSDRLTGVLPGDYSLTVSDQVLGCVAQDTFKLPDATGIVINDLTVAAPLCHNGNDGSAVLTLSNVKSPLVQWQDGQIGLRATNLLTGPIDYTITGANGCVLTGTAEIPDRPQLVTEVSSADVTCAGVCNGEIELTPDGGVGPYFINWSTGARTASILNLCAGSYDYTITDNNRCKISGSRLISSPEPISITSEASDPLCYGSSDGEITVSVTGGTGAYTYAWSSGETAATITGLADGDYTVTVTDENICTESETISITHPDPLLLLEVELKNPSCPDTEDGSINYRTDGGTPAYQYLWDDGATTQSNDGLASGDYFVTVTDAHGCATTRQFTLSLPEELSIINVSRNHPSCNGDEDGSISLEVVGGAKAYSYTWSDGSTTEDISEKQAGEYTLTVNDSKGCTVSQTIALIDPAIPVIIGVPQNVIICTNSEAVLEPEGTWTAYQWTGPNGITGSERRFTTSTKGSYTLVALDDNSCPGETSFTVDVSPNALTADFLRISEAVAFEPIVFVDISLPTPDQIEWIVPENPDVTINSEKNGVLELIFTAPGSYEIGMKAAMDNCTSELFKIIEIAEPAGGRNPDPEQTHAPEDNLQISLYPNPAKDHLEILIHAESTDPLDVRLIRALESLPVKRETLSGYKDYLIRWEIPQAPSGIYYLIYEQNKKIKSKKLVVIK